MGNSTLKLSLIHQLSRTGGTLFAKIIGNDDSNILLSEVHPSRNGKDIRKQCLKNYRIVIPQNLDTYSGSCLSCWNPKENIIVRDLSHKIFI